MTDAQGHSITEACMRKSWPGKSLGSYPALGFYMKWEKQKCKPHFNVEWQITESIKTSQFKVKEQDYFITAWGVKIFLTSQV